VRLLAIQAAAFLAIAAPAPASAAAPRVIEDDFPRALAEAKARDLPLFVDAWAPW
jgi:hypothetical protein